MAGTFRYPVEAACVDARLKARVCSLGDLILRAAGDDADTLGLGVGDLNTGGASWVLSRMAVEVGRRPRRGEQVAVYTWVSDYGRLFTTRNMTVTDDDGREIAAAVTQWAMIDLSTRRPLDLSTLAGREASLVDREPPIEMPHRLPTPAGEVVEQPHTVAYSDIDFNGHAGSMKYLEWMIDTLPPGVAEGLDALRFDINYMHEARRGDRLTVCRAAGGADGAGRAGEADGVQRACDVGVTDCTRATAGGSYRFEIRDADGTPLCRAAITTP
jgi:acyl-ACP thioesterase